MKRFSRMNIKKPDFARNLAKSGLFSVCQILIEGERNEEGNCGVYWNEAEHPWDCSCHGSRFDENGRVLNNPANDDMKHPPKP